MVFPLALYRQSRLFPTFSRPFRPVKAPLISSTTFRTAPWTRFRKFTKSTSTNAMALCSAGRAIPHQRRASAGGQPQSAEHARHPERSFALPEHHAPHGQPHSQPVNRAGGRCGCGHRTEQFGRPAHQHLSAGAAKAARPGNLNFIRYLVFFIALSGTFHSYL